MPGWHEWDEWEAKRQWSWNNPNYKVNAVVVERMVANSISLDLKGLQTKQLSKWDALIWKITKEKHVFPFKFYKKSAFIQNICDSKLPTATASPTPRIRLGSDQTNAIDVRKAVMSKSRPKFIEANPSSRHYGNYF